MTPPPAPDESQRLDALRQEQFLNVIDRDEAERRFQAELDLSPLEPEEIPLADAVGRVLARDVLAPVDVPSFDRSNVDGFAVRAEDTYGASEDQPRCLEINSEILTTGIAPREEVGSGTATGIATGAVVPRGADAVVMIEHTDIADQKLILRKPVVPGANITFAGTDIGKGETVLRRGEVLTSRETGVLAAIGLACVSVVRRPRIAIISTGDELIAPGEIMRPGLVFDSNAVILADAVRELGAQAVSFGIVPDNELALKDVIHQALKSDVVLLSGGTSKGAGDLSYRAVADLGKPGIVAHGVALKPGKPLCLAVIRREEGAAHGVSDRSQPLTACAAPSRLKVARPVPVVILPGFPTSAIFTFHEFVAPIIRRLAGRSAEATSILRARLPMRVNSERGRTEYLLVGLVESTPSLKSEIRNPKKIEQEETEETEKTDNFSVASVPSCSADSDFGFRISDFALAAYPMGKGSGSVTTFSRADGFVIIPRQREYLEAGEIVDVHLLGQGLRPADLVVIGSHCLGLDFLLGKLHEQGFRSKFLAVGSTGGLTAARRGECDLAGIHLLDPKTNTYNRPFLTDDLVLVPGYRRLQGIVYRRGDARFESHSIEEAVEAALADKKCILVNRNRGSGTRVLIDRLLGNARPPGYWTEARSHNAVAAAVAQARADWGVAIAPVAKKAGLGFLALQDEHYDFVVPKNRIERPAVRAFCELLKLTETTKGLSELSFQQE
jgi:putative molybdopterin biosynthesis protein